MDELEMRKAEVEALRNFYISVRTAIISLEKDLYKIAPVLSDEDVKNLEEIIRIVKKRNHQQPMK